MIRPVLHNLAGPSLPGPFDIIFCRNLLIYFREETVKEILEGFGGALAGDGALFLGHSELPSLHSTRWHAVSTDRAVCYRIADKAGRS